MLTISSEKKQISSRILSILLLVLTTLNIQSATRHIETSINATAPDGHHFQGHNQYSSLTTFNGNIYVFSMDEKRRPYINKINETDPKSIETSLIDKDETDIYSVYDNGHHRFSIGVDQKGYIHVFGDMHHGNQGSGRSSDTKNPLPTRFKGSIGDQMYWISDAPEDISSFTFVGFDPDKALPCNGLTYEHIEYDNNRKMYLVGRQSVRTPRAHVPGTMGLSLWRYDIKKKSWEELGAIPSDNYGFTGKTMPSIMWEPHGFGERKSVWYQNYASSMKFDVKNRMHLLCAVNADSQFNGGTHVLYAYSKNGGDTFLRKDGSVITSLPIRVTGPKKNRGTTLMTQGIEDDFDTSYMGLFWDKNFNPAFSYKRLSKKIVYYCYYDATTQKSIAGKSFNMKVPRLRSDHYALNDGSFVLLGLDGMIHHKSFTDVGIKYESKNPNIGGGTYFIREVDDKLLRDKNILRGMSFKNGEGVIISIDFKPITNRVNPPQS